MSLDRTKVQQTAQKYLAKGQYDKAIAEFQRIVREDPQDVRTWLKIGDLYTRKGAHREATDTYAKVAEHYAQQGFLRKAVAVYKQILKLDATRIDIALRLGEAYEKLQLISEALSTYETVASAYSRAGNPDASIDILKKMVELDANNVPVRVMYAEAMSKAGQNEEAVRSFEAAALLLKQLGRFDEYIRVAERLLFHRKEDVKVARELARLYLERNDGKRALSKLQVCFKSDPRDVETLELLARAFYSLDQIPKTVSVYRELARIHQETGRTDERSRILKLILDLSPSDTEARRSLASVLPPPSQSSASGSVGSVGAIRPSYADREEPELIEDEEAELLETDDVLLIDDETAQSPADLEGMGAELIPIPDEPVAQSEDASREAQLARLLTECDVYMRYGLKSKVMDQLKRVLEIEPLHVEARERLKNVYLERGMREEAVNELIALADITGESKPELASNYLKEALELSPDNEKARDQLDALSLELNRTDAPEEVLVVDDEGTTSGLSLRIDKPKTGTHPKAAVKELSVPGVSTVEEEDTSQDLASLDFQAQSPKRPKELERLRTEETPFNPDEMGAPLGPPFRTDVMTADELPGIEEFRAKPASQIAHANDEPLPERSSHTSPGEIEEILDEADFYSAQGLYDEALSTLQDSLTAHPNHPLILDKIDEIRELTTGNTSAAMSPLQGDGDNSFELAEKLAEELEPAAEVGVGSTVLDVAQVFAQFKKGVEQQIGLEDSDTHFDLGIAYKEMGLFDDAIHEFQLSMSNPQRECIAHTMIGMCYLERNEVADAISHFKKGLYAETKTEREELGLYYELGSAYEQLRDTQEAVYYYQKVQKRDPNFRRVGDKLKALSQSRPHSHPASTMDDVDRAFDDLLGDGES